MTEWARVRVPVLLLGIVVASTTAIHLSPAGSSTATWWPAAGLAAVLVIGSPRRSWPWVLGLVVAVTGVANVMSGREPLVALLFALCNAAEALVVALGLGAHRRPPQLRGIPDMVRLCAAALAGAVVIGLGAGATVAALLGGPLLTTARTVLASHLASQLLILPVALAGVEPGARTRTHRSQVVGRIVAVVALAGFAAVFTWGHLPALAFLPLPALGWAALALPRRQTSLLLLAVGLVATLATAKGHGPLAMDDGLLPTTIGVLAQLYVVVLFFVMIPLVVVVDQRTSALAVATAVLDASTANAIIGLDTTGTIRFFNVGAERMLGWRADEVIGGRPSHFYLDADAVSAHNAEHGIADGLGNLSEVLDAEGGSMESDWTWRRRDGSTFTVSVAVTTIRSESGAVEGYLAIATDVTDRLEVKRRLRESLAREQASVAELEQVNRLKTEFVSAVSHELRTPLTTILGTTQLMGAGLSGPLSPQQEQAVERLHRNGRRLLMLVEDLLTLTSAESRATSREDELRAGSVLAEAARQTCDLLTGRDLEVVVRDEAPDAVLHGDADELERALVNLVANAVKFTPDGGRVEVVSRTEDGDLVWRVSDTGMGIPEDEAGHLFERFFRARAAVSAAIPGTGLGLSIVRTIAEAHGGTANRVPHDGPGTTFELRLPLASPTPTSAEVRPVEVPT